MLHFSFYPVFQVLFSESLLVLLALSDIRFTNSVARLKLADCETDLPPVRYRLIVDQEWPSCSFRGVV